MDRIYDAVLAQHVKNENEMLFISGARQVGKTTVCLNAQQYSDKFCYLNWDDEDHKKILINGPQAVVEHMKINQLSALHPILSLDEIHKRPDWKNFLKGLYDTYGKAMHIFVSGSARLNLFQKGGDSLMGRFFICRMHPISVAECLNTQIPSSEISMPKKIDEALFQALYTFGGFPKPFLKQSVAFSNRWQNMRKEQLIYEDIRSTENIQQLNRLELLTSLLSHRAAQQLTYSSLAKDVRVSVDTITRWIEILEAFYFCFRIQPWSKNITRSLIKEPKLYLCDWSAIDDPGARAENFIAAQLKKSVQFWTDQGLGQYSLHYIRTLDKKEIDFVVCRNNEAWMLVEVKYSQQKKISPQLANFQQQTGAQHAFQVVIDMPYVDQDCFSCTTPTIVPARTFLSQLI